MLRYLYFLWNFDIFLMGAPTKVSPSIVPLLEFLDMNPAKLSRVILFLLLGGLAPLFLTQCKSTTAKSYKDISYDPAKLKTPAGHGMERKDYPFDEQGNYRKDWVKNNATGRDPSASGSSSATQIASSSSSTSASGSYPTYAEASAARATGSAAASAAASAATVAPASFVGPADTTISAPGSSSEVLLASAPVSPAVESAPPAPQRTASYHKVSSGDTLFALANRYSTSVSELKRVNGLGSDQIRVGQSLRLP